MTKPEFGTEDRDDDDDYVCTCCRLKGKFTHVDPITAFQSFAEELNQAAKDDGYIESDGGRHRAGASLNVVLHFLHHTLDRERVVLNLGPLYALNAALCDLDDGAVPLMLRPKKTAHRPPEQRCRAMVKNSAGAVCSALMRTGLRREEAAKRVLKVLLKNGFLAEGRQRATYRTILRWRDSAEDDPEEPENTRSLVLDTLREA